ncbi:MAG: O-antigen ligase family protein [Gammaproteobacteria bacterium]|nr:O-antigen ligase family protein [Gammaproteobacteria bacterium]
MKSKQNLTSDTSAESLYSLRIKDLWYSFKAEHMSFWFLCLYFLFEYIRPQVIYPVINFLPWGMVMLMMTLITVFMNPTITKVKNPLNKLLILFAFIVVLSGVFAFRPATSWKFTEIMLGWFLVYFLTINIVNNEKRLFLFILAYLLFNLKMAQFGALNWVKRGFSFAHHGLNGAPGWFQNSGEYAIQMLIYGSLAIAVVIPLKDHWGKMKKWFLYMLAIMGFFAVMGASSRGSQFALAIIVVLFILKQKNGLKGIFIFTILAFALYNLLPEEQLKRFEQVGEDYSSLQRLAYIEAGIEMIKEYPVLGIGYKNWIDYVIYKYPEGLGPLQMIQVCHNIYIEAGSELGLLGLLVFLLMILFAFINNARTRRMAKKLNNKFFFSVAYGLDAGMVGFLIAGTFVTVLYYPFFWIQITMIVMLNNVVTKTYREKLQQQTAVENSNTASGTIPP